MFRKCSSIIFFFSSRRRHTRSTRDWSSTCALPISLPRPVVEPPPTGLGKAIALRTDLPQVVVPTSYAGSEMTPILGETRDGLKTTQSSPKVLPETDRKSVVEGKRGDRERTTRSTER